MLKNYPNILEEGSSASAQKTSGKLIRTRLLKAMKIGHAYRIPKAYVLDYLKVPENALAYADGSLFAVSIKLAAFYGLRNSEVLGLKWDAIDFDQGSITIRHTIIGCNVDGKYQVVAKDTTKTKSSRRTLPLTPPIRALLMKLRDQQEENRCLCGNCYCRDYDGYICINEVGRRISPNFLSDNFVMILEKNGLRRIRFHDLRHSSASLLLANHVPLKQIQEWLGHSDFNTTANIYAHLDPFSKQNTAEAMLRGLGFEEPENSSPEK